ncbi:30S ribosomal protein S1 [Desulfofustis glycolicus]|uniref:SSU ribosomal protein S1P n=1 Tax=Desulfofustis glycolicus DSM 9705 TaxID=1121409 RepID=A0A1M5VA54_9BACT|nr:30S ribosomal protein S1 [Desulfofustis glycolicus]SHH72071.1 SSU ribosomal protein S1P [Desulfofustis glycolicus DSM 9705]
MPSDNDTFEALLKASEETSFRKLSPGQKLTATIVGIDGETLFLDVGAKSEGIIDSSEFVDENGKVTVTVGDNIEVYCLKSGPSGQVFTRRLGAGSAGAHLEEAWRNAIPVQGTVKAEIKGGFEVTVSSSVRAFCPYSQIGLRRVDDPAAEYLGKQLEFLITRFEAGGRNIVVSARALQEEERRIKREELQQTLTEGQEVDGVVSSIRSFGLFVDIGGVDGLVPISEVGWSRVDNLADTYQVGQPIKAVIKGLDWQNDRISLSIKETLPDPWQQAATQFGTGSRHTGTVCRLVPFGAFVTLAPGVDGLLHISKLGQGRKVNHPREVVEEGQQIEVIIETVDPDGRKISLAPADYVSPAAAIEKEYEELHSYRTTRQQKRKESESLSSFGALLKKKLDQKKS